jgi:hypothetical protein
MHEDWFDVVYRNQLQQPVKISLAVKLGTVPPCDDLHPGAVLNK